ncbi:MAG: hypothetical protein M0R51_18300 [Clostridia bacterium]|jgi:pyridoxal biosynthesis lyase PdxS|nr:hypothetical protein [Clostridia bacterium]
MIDYESVSRKRYDMAKTSYIKYVQSLIDSCTDKSEKKFYSQFLNIDTNNKEELSEAMWALNKGKLRDEAEIDKHKAQLEQYKKQEEARSYVDSGEFNKDVNENKHLPVIIIIAGMIITPILFMYNIGLAIVIMWSAIFIGIALNFKQGKNAEEKARKHNIEYHDKRIIQSKIAAVGAIGSMYFNGKKNTAKLFEDDSQKQC